MVLKEKMTANDILNKILDIVIVGVSIVSTYINITIYIIYMCIMAVVYVFYSSAMAQVHSLGT